MNLADSVLFRYMQIPYLKLSPEDIESFQMQVKANMPVLMSSYPSSQIYSSYDYLKIPFFGSIDYRINFFKQYQFNKIYIW